MEIASTTQFPLGKLPFRYLGVHLSSKRLYVADCKALVEKLTSMIKTWSAKSLFYTARLQLRNSVLMSISSYWCQIFVFPKKMINMINTVCRSFLWFGVSNNSKPRNMSWSKVCKPKKFGGLGIRNLHLWNLVAIGKVVCYISSKWILMVQMDTWSL